MKAKRTDKYPQLTEVSERNLAYPILHNNVFDSITINRYLALYPSARESEKADVISAILKELWSKEKLFNAFKVIDNFLATSGKRGHFLHQFEVFLLGLNLLLAFKEMRSDFVTEFGFETFDQALFAWQVTALTHDFGYPVEDGHKIFQKLRQMYSEFGLDFLASHVNVDKVKDLVEKDHNMTKVYFKKTTEDLLGSFIDINSIVVNSLANSLKIGIPKAQFIANGFIADGKHGYISSLLSSRILLQDIIDEAGHSDISSHWKYKVLSLSSGAIALHNLSPDKPSDVEIMGLISFNANPFAYLLFVIDNIQDWNRTLFKDNNYAEYKLADFEAVAGGVTLEYTIVHENWDRDVLDSIDKFLSDKAMILGLLQKPNPLFNINLRIEFTRSDGHKYDPIEMKI